jgi:hypothetical protein
MTITRAQAETVLTKRCGPMMTAAAMDGTTNNGTNDDLNDPLGWAVVQLGGSVSDITDVTDSDVGSVDVTDERYILDMAEYRLLGNILSNLTLVDIKAGPRSESLSQLATRLEKRVERLEKQLAQEVGFGEATLSTGVIEMDFVEHVETTS